jgi:hypothetical protein
MGPADARDAYLSDRQLIRSGTCHIFFVFLVYHSLSGHFKSLVLVYCQKNLEN